MKKKWLVGILGMGISFAALWIISRRIDWKSAIKKLTETDPIYFLLLFMILSVTFLLRGLRWRLMFPKNREDKYMVYFNGIIIGYAGNNVLPARGGELLRMEYFSQKTGKTRVTSLSSIFAEKVIDGLALLGLLMGVLFFSRNKVNLDAEWLNRMVIGAGIIFFSAFAGLMILRIYNKQLVDLIKKKNSRLINVFAAVIEKISGALEFFKLDRNSIRLVITSLLVWIAEGLMYVIALHAFGFEKNIFIMGYMTLAVVAFGILVPSSPAYIGVFQGMTILSLSLFGIPENDALSVSLLVHVMQFLPVTLYGLVIIFVNSLKIVRMENKT